MNKTKKTEVSTDKPLQQKCFTVTVDGKKYGPFLSKYRPNISKIEHLAGVTVDDVWLFTGWLQFEQPKPVRTKRDKTTPLFDGLDFVAVPRQKGCTF